MTRRYIFDAVRQMLGRGFTPAEVKALDEAIDAAIAGGPAPADDWIALAAPLVEQFEGLAKLIPGDKVQAYPDPGSGGEPWTIGIGSTTDELGNPVRPGDVWPVARARTRFQAHLAEFGHEVDRLIAGKPTTAAQKAAMTSLAYNIGVGAFSGSTVLRRHRAGDYVAAADAFALWNNAGGRVMAGLTRRRKAEAELYRKGSN